MGWIVFKNETSFLFPLYFSFFKYSFHSSNNGVKYGIIWHTCTALWWYGNTWVLLHLTRLHKWASRSLRNRWSLGENKSAKANATAAEGRCRLMTYGRLMQETQRLCAHSSLHSCTSTLECRKAPGGTCRVSLFSIHSSQPSSWVKESFLLLIFPSHILCQHENIFSLQNGLLVHSRLV